MHKSVKHLKNSQYINYATDTKFDYTEIQIIAPSFFLHISQMLNMSTFGYTAASINPFHHTRVSAYHGRPEPQQWRIAAS
jgi:hypothetical protein